MSLEKFLKIFECPKCHDGDLAVRGDSLACKKCGETYAVIGGVPDLVVGGDHRYLPKWESVHAAADDGKADAVFGMLAKDHKDTFEKSGILAGLASGDMVLDVGCGKGYVSHALADTGKTVVGIDFVMEPLLFAKRKFERGALNGLFVRADMFNLPFKDKSFKFAYSLGVLEHNRNIAQPVREMGRVLKAGGSSFNVVPAISVSSLTYGQLWGNIPNIPVLKELFHWLHFRLFRGRHCIYGYELSYSCGQLRKIFRGAGYGVNKTGVSGITVPVYYVKNGFLKAIMQAVISNRIFARHIYIYSERP